MNELIIDAKDAILGRLASYAAKQSLLGNKIIIINCEIIIVSGKPKSIIKEYREMRVKGGASLHGPFFPKHPDRIMKRTIRGMLSYKKGRGKEALKRIKCYNGVTEEYENVKKIVAGKEKRNKAIKLNVLSKEI